MREQHRQKLIDIADDFGVADMAGQTVQESMIDAIMDYFETNVSRGSITMGFKPLHDLVLVQPDESTTETESGLLLVNEEQSNYGVVLAVGPGKINDNGERSPMYVNEGDRVMVASWGLNEYNHEGNQCYLVKHSDIVAVV